MIRPSGGERFRQGGAIAKNELRRAFFARRSLWVYLLALLPATVFFGHGLHAKFRTEQLARHGGVSAASIDSVRDGETVDAVAARLGPPAEQDSYTRTRRVRQRSANPGTTSHV